jgi:hypothetical protein
MRRKRLNVTRTVGRFEFERVTARLHDGTPDGETLWVRTKRGTGRDSGRSRWAAYCSHRQGLTDWYFATGPDLYGCNSAVQRAKAMRAYLVSHL